MGRDPQSSESAFVCKSKRCTETLDGGNAWIVTIFEAMGQRLPAGINVIAHTYSVDKRTGLTGKMTKHLREIESTESTTSIGKEKICSYTTPEYKPEEVADIQALNKCLSTLFPIEWVNQKVYPN